MANNRLWAVCKDDEECVCLCKYYPGPPGWGGGMNERDDFFLKHDDCPSNHGCGENILFVTEMDDARVELYDFTDFNNVKIRLKSNEVKGNNFEQDATNEFEGLIDGYDPFK